MQRLLKRHANNTAFNASILPDTLLDPADIAEVEMETEDCKDIQNSRGSVPAVVEQL